MLAARLHGNSDLRVDQVPEPDAVGPGQVRAEPQWCGICGTDLHEYAHGPLYTPAENLPQVMGHEFSAVIAEAARGSRPSGPATASPCSRTSSAAAVSTAFADGRGYARTCS
jgi:threonine dehydrogenase-like Zn-dependent dehydrogenase